ncbi:MAG TPA: hypothetical protein VN644_15535 [Pyrinomonadaceae bacterium]|nr:hypothetical protein [Pyrinomonadaceae bacterium]
MKPAYKAAYEQAIEDLTTAMETQERLALEAWKVDREVSLFRESALALGNLCGKSEKEVAAEHPELFPESIDPDTGLTDAVRKALQSVSNVSLSPVQVRNRMEKMGFDLKAYKNVLASIHTILKRLQTKGDVSTRERDGKTVYRWSKVIVKASK